MLSQSSCHYYRELQHYPLTFTLPSKMSFSSREHLLQSETLIHKQSNNKSSWLDIFVIIHFKDKSPQNILSQSILAFPPLGFSAAYSISFHSLHSCRRWVKLMSSIGMTFDIIITLKTIYNTIERQISISKKGTRKNIPAKIAKSTFYHLSLTLWSVPRR